jgi:hypothetical protein
VVSPETFFSHHIIPKPWKEVLWINHLHISLKLLCFCLEITLIECQVLCRLVDSLFEDTEEQQYVYDFMCDLVVYLSTFEEHLKLLGEVGRQIEMVGFTLTVKTSIWLKRKLNFGNIFCLHGVLRY